MKLGFFFGSFDPPHIGHLSIISEVLNEGLIDRVVVIPAYHNPWKEGQTKYNIRLDMTREAFKSYGEIVEVSDVEGELHAGESHDEIYTWRVLEELKEMYCDDDTEIFLITTDETIQEIFNWKKGIEIYNDNKFIVVSRSEVPLSLRSTDIRIYLDSPISVSSTILRERIHEGRIISEYLPRNVEPIIKQLKLYE